MGLHIGFSSSTYESRENVGVGFQGLSCSKNESDEKAVKLPNPDPANFEVIKAEVIGNHLVMMVQYPDCTNYEGKKILVYRDTSVRDLFDQKHIDPHFCNNPKFKSPFARFEPTDDGWKVAKLMSAGISF